MRPAVSGRAASSQRHPQQRALDTRDCSFNPNSRCIEHLLPCTEGADHQRGTEPALVLELEENSSDREPPETSTNRGFPHVDKDIEAAWDALAGPCGVHRLDEVDDRSLDRHPSLDVRTPCRLLISAFELGNELDERRAVPRDAHALMVSRRSGAAIARLCCGTFATPAHRAGGRRSCRTGDHCRRRRPDRRWRSERCRPRAGR